MIVIGGDNAPKSRDSLTLSTMSDSFKNAVAADDEAKKHLIDCRLCQEKVPREEANTDSCSGCAASYDRDYFHWDRQEHSPASAKMYAAPQHTCMHCKRLVSDHKNVPMCDNNECISDDCWCYIRSCKKD